MQDQDLRPAQQRRVQREARIFGRRAHQRDGALLDKGQEPVLLRAVEAVDLVHEQQRLAPDLGHGFGVSESLLEVRKP